MEDTGGGLGSADQNRGREERIGVQRVGGRRATGHGEGEGATIQGPRSFKLLLSPPGRRSDATVLRFDPGQIEYGDGHYGGELMRSVEAFIEENGQWVSARRAGCTATRHTMRDRIRRVGS